MKRARSSSVLSGVCAVVFLRLAAAQLGAQSYTLNDLGTFGGSRAQATGINEAGAVVGWFETAVGVHAFLWTPADGLRDLGTLGGENSRAWAINDVGHVVGEADTADATHAFLWTPADGLQDLGTLGGTDSAALDINNAGQVVGWAETGEMYECLRCCGDTPELPAHHAFLWTGGPLADLGALGGANSGATAINKAGVIIGWAETGVVGSDAMYSQDRFYERHVFRYQGGVMEDLGAFLSELLTDPADVNAAGQVVGVATSPFDGVIFGPAFSWQDGSAESILLPGGDSARASAVNDLGAVVGSAWTRGIFESIAREDKHAYLWKAGEIVDLNDVLADDVELVLTTAGDINERGAIVGSAFAPDDTEHAYVLTPVTPETPNTPETPEAPNTPETPETPGSPAPCPAVALVLLAGSLLGMRRR